MFWTEIQSSVILKLLRGHVLNYQVRSNTRNLTGSHIWLKLPIQTHRGLTTPVHTAQLHVPPHCGQWSCAHHVAISELPCGPLTANNSRAQSRTQRIIQAAQPQGTHQKAPGRSRLFVWLSGLPHTLDWPVTLSLPQVKVSFLSRTTPFQHFRSGLHSTNIWNKIPRGISPHPALWEEQHSSPGWSAACSFPLWVRTLHLPVPVPELSSKYLPFSHNHDK